MKKILALVLALSATTAFAGHYSNPSLYSAGITYDFNDARSNSKGFKNVQEGSLFVDRKTPYGKFDLSLLGTRFEGKGHDNANGFEVGYGNNVFSYGRRCNLTSRVAFGRITHIDAIPGQPVSGTASYVSVGVEGHTPVSGATDAFVGFRHRNGFGDNMAHQNRFSVGVDHAITDRLSLRLGYAHTRQAEHRFNGLTSSANFTF